MACSGGSRCVSNLEYPQREDDSSSPEGEEQHEEIDEEAAQPVTGEGQDYLETQVFDMEDRDVENDGGSEVAETLYLARDAEHLEGSDGAIDGEAWDDDVVECVGVTFGGDGEEASACTGAGDAGTGRATSVGAAAARSASAVGGAGVTGTGDERAGAGGAGTDIACSSDGEEVLSTQEVFSSQEVLSSQEVVAIHEPPSPSKFGNATNLMTPKPVRPPHVSACVVLHAGVSGRC